MHVPDRVVITARGRGRAIGRARRHSSESAAPAAQERGGQEEFGPYELVANWPQPLPDGADGVKHDGWTWGSVGAVYAETPDRIWIAQRGELPLPADAKPWTPYSLLHAAAAPPPATTDGLSATCEPVEKRGWERRYHHVDLRRRSQRQDGPVAGRTSTRCSTAIRAAAARTRSR